MKSFKKGMKEEEGEGAVTEDDVKTLKSEQTETVQPEEKKDEAAKN